MYVSLLPVIEACVVVAVPGRVGEVRVTRPPTSRTGWNVRPRRRKNSRFAPKRLLFRPKHLPQTLTISSKHLRQTLRFRPTHLPNTPQKVLRSTLEPEAVDLDPGVLARRLDAPATVKAVLEQGGRMLLQRGSRRRRGRGCVWSSGSTHPKQNRNSYNQFGLRGKKKSRLIKIHGFLPFSARRCALVPIPVPP